MFSVKNKTILITGASSGIGRYTAVLLASQGANLILTGRSREKMDSLMAELNNPVHKVIVCDLDDENNIKTLAQNIESLDGLVYSAGVVDYTLYKFFSREKYEKVFNVNFYSAIQLTNYLIKFKKVNKDASLVYISSISSILGVPATTFYGASKAALNTAVKVLASELAPKNIRANTIMPGIVKTPMIEGASDQLNAEAFEKAEKLYPLGLGTPHDIASAALFLLSSESRWITGTSLLIDGGHSLQ